MSCKSFVMKSTTWSQWSSSASSASAKITNSLSAKTTSPNSSPSKNRSKPYSKKSATSQTKSLPTPSIPSKSTTTTTSKISTSSNPHNIPRLSTLSSMLTIIRGWHYLKVIIFRRWMKGMWKGIMGPLRMGIGVIIIGRSLRRMRRSFLVMRWAQRSRSLCRRWMIFP